MLQNSIPTRPSGAIKPTVSPQLKELKIKSGVVKRIHKEWISYQKEHQKQLERIEKMKQDGQDEYEIKQQYKVLDETVQILPDCKSRLQTSFNELSQFLTQYLEKNPSAPGEEENEEVTTAKQTLESAKQVI